MPLWSPSTSAYAAERQFIDMALFDTQLAWLVNVAHSWFATGSTPQRQQRMQTSCRIRHLPQDGYVTIGIGTDGQYRRFCLAAGHPVVGWLRWRQMKDVYAIVSVGAASGALFRAANGGVALDLFFCPQYSRRVDQRHSHCVVRSPQAQTRGMVQRLSIPLRLNRSRSVAKLSRTRRRFVLRRRSFESAYCWCSSELGYSAETIAAWREQVSFERSKLEPVT